MADLRGSSWQKCDLHIHSNASDGKMTCEEIVDKAIEKDLNVIALTDHHTAKNINEIIMGKASIIPETALQLARKKIISDSQGWKFGFFHKIDFSN